MFWSENLFALLASWYLGVAIAASILVEVRFKSIWCSPLLMNGKTGRQEFDNSLLTEKMDIIIQVILLHARAEDTFFRYYFFNLMDLSRRLSYLALINDFFRLLLLS